MTEPISSATAAAASVAGLTIFGIATGLDPAVLIAGLAGGLWGQTLLPAAPAVTRVGRAALASVVAGYITPAASAGAAAALARVGLQDAIAGALLQNAAAVVVGLYTHLGLGRWLLRIAERRAEAVGAPK